MSDRCTDASSGPDDYFDDDEYEPDEYEDEMYDCHGFFESQSPSAVFICGAVGSEDCDECPCYEWLGLTSKQIDALEEERDGE